MADSPSSDKYITSGEALPSLGKYQLLAELGRGGNGIVYRASDQLLHRIVAIKVLPRDSVGSQNVLERFLREARANARINHPHVVVIHEVDEHNGEYFIAMEYLPGGSALELLEKRGALPWPDATRIVRDACRGLATAHAARLIHRDIKPANILLNEKGMAKLADFGLAKDLGDLKASLTEAGFVAGTPHYMSPEQCRNERLDERSDIYALGATFYTLLTGRPPFDAPGAGVLLAHCTAKIPDPRAIVPAIPDVVAKLVMKALAKQPGERQPSARKLLSELDAALKLAPAADSSSTDSHKPLKPEIFSAATIVLETPSEIQRQSRRRSRWLIVALAALAVIAVLVVVFWPKK